MTTRPDVFIIESLTKSDEEEQAYEGKILSDVLRLCGKDPIYCYFRSKHELPHLLDRFRASKCRYLHLTCHATGSDLQTTIDTLSYAQFAAYLKGHMPLRRLFCSACELGNKRFVDEVAIANKGMHSIAAPTSEILYEHSAAAWAAFYVSMFTEDDDGMSHENIHERLRVIVELFPVEFLFATYHAHNETWKSTSIASRKQTAKNGSRRPPGREKASPAPRKHR